MKKNPLNNKRETGFKIPQEYFNSFEESLKSKIASKPFPKETGFKTPKGYFDSLSDEKYTTEEKDTKVISLNNWKTISMIASAAAVLVILFNILDSNTSMNFETIETAQIENYLLDEQISNEELAMVLSEEALSLESFLEFEEENIEDYLLENATLENLITE